MRIDVQPGCTSWACCGASRPDRSRPSWTTTSRWSRQHGRPATRPCWPTGCPGHRNSARPRTGSGGPDPPMGTSPLPGRDDPHVVLLRRIFLTIVIASSLLLIPWIAYLAVSLPDHHVAGHWKAAWVGFDVGL